MKSIEEKILDTLQSIEKRLKDIEKNTNKSNYIKQTLKAGKPINVRHYANQENQQDW